MRSTKIATFRRWATTSIAWAGAGLILLLLAGCGLPSEQPTLLAPTVPQGYFPDNTNVFTFNNTPQPSTVVLLGFELYYKLYDNLDNPATVQYQTDEDKINNLLNPGISDLTSIGFKPLYALPAAYVQGNTIPTRTSPLVPLPSPSLAASSFAVDIPLGVSGSGTGSPPAQDFFPGVFVAGQASPEIQVARYLPNPQNTGSYILKGFGSGDFALTDAIQNGGDVPNTAVANSTTGVPQSLLLAIYAIAYGQLPDFSNTLYSTPIPLGTIPLSVTFTQ